MKKADFGCVESAGQCLCISIINNKVSVTFERFLEFKMDKLDFGEKIKVLGNSVPEVKSAACAPGEIELLD